MKKIIPMIALMAALSLLGAAAFVGCSSGGDSPTGSASRAIIRDTNGEVVANGEIRLDGNPIGSTGIDGEVVIASPLSVGFYQVEVYVGGQFVTAAVIEIEDDGSLEVDDGFENSDEIDSDDEESDDANSAVDSVEDGIPGGGSGGDSPSSEGAGDSSLDDDNSDDD